MALSSSVIVISWASSTQVGRRMPMQ